MAGGRNCFLAFKICRLCRSLCCFEFSSLRIKSYLHIGCFVVVVAYVVIILAGFTKVYKIVRSLGYFIGAFRKKLDSFQL